MGTKPLKDPTRSDVLVALGVTALYAGGAVFSAVVDRSVALTWIFGVGAMLALICTGVLEVCRRKLTQFRAPTPEGEREHG